MYAVLQDEEAVNLVVSNDFDSLKTRFDKSWKNTIIYKIGYIDKV